MNYIKLFRKHSVKLKSLLANGRLCIPATVGNQKTLVTLLLRGKAVVLPCSSLLKDVIKALELVN